MSCRNEPRAGSLDGTAGTAYRASTEQGREFGQRDSSPRGRKSSTCPSGKSLLRNDSDFWNAVAVTTQTSPRNYPGSCSQREPEKGQTLLRPPAEVVVTRREFIGTLAGALLAAPLAVEAQPAGKVWRIGFLSLQAPLVSYLCGSAACVGARRQGVPAA